MPMVDLARTPKEVKEIKEETYEPSKYNYGLELRLGEDELEKLGEDNFKVGEMVSFVAQAKVVSRREDENDSYESKSVGLQIQGIDLGEKEEPADNADKLFG